MRQNHSEFPEDNEPSRLSDRAANGFGVGCLVVGGLIIFEGIRSFDKGEVATGILVACIGGIFKLPDLEN